MQFMIVTADYTHGLAAKVNDLLAEGWELYGNVFVSSHTGLYHVAMTRRQNDGMVEMNFMSEEASDGIRTVD